MANALTSKDRNKEYDLCSFNQIESDKKKVTSLTILFPFWISKNIKVKFSENFAFKNYTS